MIIAGIKMLICLGFMLGPDASVGDPNQAINSVSRNSEILRRQMELQRVSAIEPNQPTQADTLRQVVTQLQSLQWSTNSAVASGVGANEKLKEEKKKAAGTTPPALISSPVSAENKESGATQAGSLEEVKKPVNAMATADALYQAKDYSHAVRFYQMAAESKDQDVPASCQWALYQTANCLRYQDGDTAIKAYQQLIAEYPNSPWTAAATAQQKNLEWFKQNQNILSKNTTHNDPNQQ
jgi:tetratricopeptide (TPR) repeat protein